MKRNLVIFGIGKIAEVVYYYANEECGYNVVAFCVDAEFKNADTFQGVPLVSFEKVEEIYPANANDIFIAVGYHDLNALREKKCDEARNKGYHLVSIISPLANVPKNVSVGWNCFIMPPAIIHPCVVIKNNVFIWSGTMVGHHSIIEDNCWLTSSCNIGGNVTLGANTFMAVNATIGHSVSVGKNCFIGANALATKNVLDEQVLIVESTKPIRLTSKQFLILQYGDRR